MTAKKTPVKKPIFKSIVTYHLPSGDRDVPALVSAVEGSQATLTVFDLTGSYVASGVKHGSGEGCWS